MKSIVKKVNFIFEHRSTKPPLESTKTLQFFKFMETDRIDDGFKFPFEYELHYVNHFSNYKLDKTSVNVFVVMMNIDYIKIVDLDWLYNLQDNNPNVVLLADYSNESLLPGNYNNKNAESINFQTERFICTILSLQNNAEIQEPKFKKVFPVWMFATGVMEDILARRNEKHLHNIPPFTWPRKETHKKFFFPNRLGREHRLNLLVEAHHRGLLQKCEWTFMVPSTEGYLDTYDSEHEYWKLFGTNYRGIAHTEFEDNWSNPSSHLNQGGPHEAFPMTVLERTMAVIISDTYNDDHPILDCSEKILKPLMYGMPVFFNGRRGVLSKLKEYGFWFPGNNYNDLESNRTSKLIQNCLDFEDVITKETAEHVSNNKRLMFDRHTHYKFSKELFEYILDI